MSIGNDAVIYHLYPLGAAGAPMSNDPCSPPADRWGSLYPWIDAAADVGATAIQLGPVWESSAHGYDTADYFHVDRRLGSDDDFARWSAERRRRGLGLILDGVFHHTGRDFWAFRDVQRNGEGSPYRDWYVLDFSRSSPYGDPFAYQGWNGHFDLVKLNTANPEVRGHLFDAARSWIERFDIDGLRLDAADVLDRDFQRALAAHCRAVRPDFWLGGEVVHGDYRCWAGPGMLDAVTNYELYKALFSAHNAGNYHEIAFALSRQSDEGYGLYRGLPLVTFADNHDVDRIASRLTNPAHLYPLYALLLTAPGIPAIYYGSEWGIEGRKGRGSDAPLRPALDPAALHQQAPHPDLRPAVQRLIALRRGHPALHQGSYRQLAVGARHLLFLRAAGGECVVVAVHAGSIPATIAIDIPGSDPAVLVDLLNPGDTFTVRGGRVVLPMYPNWARILRLERR